MKKGNSVKFVIQFKYHIFFFAFATLFLMSFPIIGLIFFWEINTALDVAGLIGFAVLILISALIAISQYQTAILNEYGITIKSPLITYCKLKWEDIESVSVKYKPTMSNFMAIYWKYNWIHISTGNDISEKRYSEVRNRKNKSPYVILYKPKHAKLLSEYLTKYRPDIDLKDLLTLPTAKPNAKWGHW